MYIITTSSRIARSLESHLINPHQSVLGQSRSRSYSPGIYIAKSI